MASNGNIANILRRFRRDWSAFCPEKIAHFLTQASESDRNKLLVELIETDLQFRSEIGDRPLPQEYASLHPDAKMIAGRLLNDLPSTFDRPEPTRLDSPLSSSTPQSFPLFEDRFGPYELLDRIGEGGMGVVWIAEQREPIKRRVALKVIRRDIVSQEAIKRFEAERQTIALMDHLNIAKLLDAGTSAGGNPYFVMELVDGEPIDKYCDRKKLGIRERMELLLPVALAVQHAHQKGIVHRDLKPNNVLVCEYDGKPVPKIIDFGLAKFQSHERKLEDASLVTEIGRVVGTLQYMSPEQAESGNKDIDTRSDIYSLGVLIYKLLTGTTPLESKRLSDLNLIDALRVIQSEDPGRPASRLKIIPPEKRLQICEQRGTTQVRLRQLLAGDLEWIAMKSLEKDREHRYQTCNELAQDIERYLNDEKVLARAGSVFYNVKKFVKRNKGLVASAAALSTLLVAGIVATSVLTFWAVVERNRANDNSRIAKEETQAARLAEQDARESEKRRARQQKLAEANLYSMRIKSAWSDWQLGNAETAWQTLNQIDASAGNWETRFLHQEFNSVEHVFHGQALWVNQIALSADGSRLASISGDYTIQVWSTADNRKLFRHVLDEEPTDVSFSPDANQIVVVDLANKITLLDASSGKVRKEVGPFSQDLTCICFDEKGEHVFVGSSGTDTVAKKSERDTIDTGRPFIRRVDLESGAVIQELRGHTDEVSELALSVDGNNLISASLDSTVRVWTKESSDFQPRLTLDNHFGAVASVAVSPKADEFASCGYDKAVRRWRMSDGKLIRSILGHNERVNDVAYSQDGERLVSAANDGFAIVWNLKGDELIRCRGHYGDAKAALFSPCGQHVYTGSSDSAVRRWDSQRQPATTTISAHENTIWCIDVSADESFAACASSDGFVSIVDLKKHLIEENRIQHSAADGGVFKRGAFATAISPNCQLIATGGADGQTRIWNRKSLKLIATFGHSDTTVWDLSFSSDGQYLATANGREIEIWDTDTWTLHSKLEGHSGEVASVDFSAEGMRLVSASDDLTVKMWNLDTGEVEHTFADHITPVWRAMFSPDGQTIASSSYDGAVIIWDVETRRVVHKLKAHSNQIAGLDYSPDGKRLVTASDDATIVIHELDTGTPIFVLRDKGDRACVDAVFAKTGGQLITGNADGYLTIRTAVESGNESAAFLPERTHELGVAQLSRLLLENLSREELKKELRKAEEWCDHFYNFGTLSSLGIIQYRLGQYEQAVESLEEASRLENIQYGEPDMIPVIDSYLAMSLLKTGNCEKAEATRKLFTRKRNSPFWKGVSYVESLWEEMESTFESYQDGGEAIGKPQSSNRESHRQSRRCH